MNSYGVYHIACIGDWVSVFNDQINTMLNSGLLKVVEKVYLSVILSCDDDLFLIREKIKDLNIEISYTSKNFKEYEFPALKLITEICRLNNCKIFYIHTKGVSITEDNMGFYHGSTDINHLRNCVNDWRKYMEYFIIENYETCLNVLDKYDACGVNLTSTPTKHFSGNFWWSTSNHINNLTNIDDVNKGHRWNAEFWIGSNNGNLYNLYTTECGYVNRINGEYINFNKIK
jgi:hypothetical protein